MESFSIATTPQLHFGSATIKKLPALVKKFGTKLLLVTGARSFTNSIHGEAVLDQLNLQSINIRHTVIDGEPTPKMIDDTVNKFPGNEIDVVVAIGGGSVLDAGKAIAAMLPLNESVKDYLEGIGTKIHSGEKIPFIAIPTTAGTGSEATKNAVISEIGNHGFKKSLRHDNFVPNVAIIDPALTVSCPPSATAASGMDAFTQLLESYVSTKANAITDALAYQGLEQIARSLKQAYEDGENLEARTGMAMAAYLSGITLANAGLGLVHGFASSIGGYFEIPHGVICSSLMASVNSLTVKKLREQNSSSLFLNKYSTIGKMFTTNSGRSNEYYINVLLNTIDEFTSGMKIPRLSEGGVSSADFKRIVAATDNKNNPVKLSQEEMTEVLTLAI